MLQCQDPIWGREVNMHAVMLPFRECTPSKASTLSDRKGLHTSHDCGRTYAHSFTLHEAERAVCEERRRT